MSKWTLHINWDANILLKSLNLRGLSVGPKFILPKWSGMKNQLWAWNSNKAGVYFLHQEMERFHNLLESVSLGDSSFPRRYKKMCRLICDETVKNIKKISNQASGEVSLPELNKLFLRFCREYQRLGGTIIITLNEAEANLAKKLDSPKDLTFFVASSELSWDGLEELSRLKIIDFINREYRPLFIDNDIEIIKKELPKLPLLRNKIIRHIEKFCWIPLNFNKEIWDLSFFLNLFQSYLKDSYDYRSRIKELEDYPKQMHENRKKVRAKADRETKIIGDLLEARSYVRLYRANVYSLAYYSAFPLLKEISKKVFLPFNLLRYFTPDEISAAVENGRGLTADVAARRKVAFVMLVEEGIYRQMEGKEAESYISRACPVEKIKDADKVIGVCAYPGKVRGRVKIIFDAREMNKVKNGDILVCNATNPDLVIVMSRCGAIVTEQGGITSHAAIVSREMKKPCVIGTKVATKVFKDGDMVEVDAEKGIVRKIK